MSGMSNVRRNITRKARLFRSSNALTVVLSPLQGASFCSPELQLREKEKVQSCRGKACLALADGLPLPRAEHDFERVQKLAEIFQRQTPHISDAEDAGLEFALAFVNHVAARFEIVVQSPVGDPFG